MTLFIVVLPLRLSGRRVNLSGMLGQGLDKHYGSGTSQSYVDDLQRLGDLRKEMTQQIYEKDSYDEGVQFLTKLQEYYHLLVECETKLGPAVVCDEECLQELEWESSLSNGEVQSFGSISWERANVIWNMTCLEAYQASKQDLSKKQGWSKAAQHFQNAACWLKQILHLPPQNMPTAPHYQYSDFSTTFLKYWQTLLMAQSQRCVYESLACAPRPKHLLLAKLATAAVPLFNELDKILKQDETKGQNILSQFAGLTNNWADFARAWGMFMNSRGEYHQSCVCHEKKKFGEEIARLELAYQFATLCKEYCERVPLIALQQLHTTVDEAVNDIQTKLQSAESENTTQEKPQRQDLNEIRGERVVNIEQPLSKILKPYKGRPIFQNLLDPTTTSDSGIAATTDSRMMMMPPSAGGPTSTAMGSSSAPPPMAAGEGAGMGMMMGSGGSSGPMTGGGGGGPVRSGPQGGPSPMGSMGMPKPPPNNSGGGSGGMVGGRGIPGAMNSNNAGSGGGGFGGRPSRGANIMVYVKAFHSEMDKLVFQMSSVAEERTESARQALAAVNLPHSLTAYNQEQAGGGIPQELWQRVDALQRERRIAKLKQDLWELRDVAEVARNTFHEVEKELDFDLESDRLFRQANQGFQGHDAEHVQKSFRDSLANYDRLLTTAQEGDSVLLKRLGILDTNPKYKLLQFQKPQLDRLLPGAQQNQHGGPPTPAIDTSYLSRLLVELSGLFHKRDVLLNTIKEEVEMYDIEGTLRSRGGSGTDSEYREALKYAQKGFDAIVYEMQNNIEAQTELVNTILAENEQFMLAREKAHPSGHGGGASTAQSADSCIGMIEDALEEIEQLTKHLKEGRDFYDVVIPKLVKLKQQVGDVSARLTVERLEHEDNHSRNRQQEEDARMAQQMNHSNQQGSAGGRAAGGPPNGGRGPGGQGGSGVYVDDEKVATLVAMEFDPAKVVAALEKHNNNVDQALNELLSC